MPLHPQAQQLIDDAKRSGLPEIQTLSPERARELFDERASGLTANPVIGEVYDRVIPGPAGDLTVRIYRPADADEATPGLMFFHGGGWVIGTIDTHDLVCRALTEATAATVISVSYRLAPEHPFPAAPDDCAAATRWVAEHGAEIGVDGSRLATCGDSAGGNLAAVVAQDCVGGPGLRAQVMVYPCVDASNLDRESMHSNGEGFLLSAVGMRWFYDHYAPTTAERENPRVSPLLGELNGLPPALVLTAEFDPLHDEGHEYAEALSEAGVDVEYHRYDGQVHTFFTQVGYQDASLDSVRRIASFLAPRW